VVAEADGSVVALGWTNAGDGALYPGDAGGQPHEMETGKEVGETETTPFKNRKDRMKNQNCHFSRTGPAHDPFTFTVALLLRKLNIIGMALLLCVICACRSDTKHNLVGEHDSLASIWSSTNSTAQEKVDAVNRYIPAGTDVASVKKLLGEDGSWGRHHGGTLDPVSGRTDSYDIWQLEYKTAAPGTLIVLEFHQGPDSAQLLYLFNHAFTLTILGNFKRTDS
jgi:hypothetical protein